MSLKYDLIERGYFPEDLPPSFTSTNISDYFSNNPPPRFLSRSKNPVRFSPYNSSKRGLTRRVFSVMHPVTAYDLAEFTSARWKSISGFLGKSTFSMSIPEHTEDGQRALKIMSHGDAEQMRLSQLSHSRFIAKTDISRFYHSIYTHSIPWAFHGKAGAKADRNPQSAKIFFNRADQILRCGQDGQTIGIPVGPDVSRVIAEIIATAIDLNFHKRNNSDIQVLRHVDDVWIGANTHAEAEEGLWRYREAIREFELDINENKTQIYESDFSFSDRWPTQITRQIEYAIHSHSRRIPERLRAALEASFSYAADGDDGVLKYTIRFLDRNKPTEWDQWSSIEPFLKRCAVHYGHTIDYVVRVLVWRHLTRNDLDLDTWSNILNGILDRHGRLGNDSEVCWALYACMRLEIQIHEDVAKNIIDNCGPLSILAIANCADLKLTKSRTLTHAQNRLNLETDSGPFWPVLLEWKSRQWPRHTKVEMSNETISEMANNGVTVFDANLLPGVFRDVDEEDFGNITEAIEGGTGDYDEDYDKDDEIDDDIDWGKIEELL